MCVHVSICTHTLFFVLESEVTFRMYDFYVLLYCPSKEGPKFIKKQQKELAKLLVLCYFSPFLSVIQIVQKLPHGEKQGNVFSWASHHLPDGSQKVLSSPPTPSWSSPSLNPTSLTPHIHIPPIEEGCSWVFKGGTASPQPRVGLHGQSLENQPGWHVFVCVRACTFLTLFCYDLFFFFFFFLFLLQRWLL